MEEYILNPGTEVVPIEADRYELRLPLWGHTLVANAQQLASLRRFKQWALPDAVAEQAWLERCLDGGFLLGRLPSGKARFPQRIRALPAMLGAPAHRADAPSALTVLGAPWSIGTSGAAGGATAIRHASQHARYAIDPALRPRGFLDLASGRTLLEGVTISDAGDVRVASGEDPHDAYDRITEAVRRLLDSGTTPLILGGDHSITYPILRAFPHERLGVIQFDTRPDLGPLEPGGLDPQNVFSWVLERLEFVERIHQIGLRGLAPGGVMRPERATWYGIDRARALGAVMLAEALPDDLPYYVSIDMRVVDPDGLQPHELKSMLRAIAAAREIVGIDVVEVGRPGAVGDRYAQLAVEAALTVADSVRPR